MPLTHILCKPRSPVLQSAPRKPIAHIIFPDLPYGAYEGDRWDREFVPTVLRCLGFCTVRSAFAWEPEFSVPFLRAIWKEVYGSRVSWTVEMNDLVYTKVCFLS